MKKVYVSMAAILAAVPAFALTTPYILDDMMVAGITPDGKYALCDDQFNSVLSLVEIESGDVLWECYEQLKSATRHVISNTLVVPCSTETDEPYYVIDGISYPLPVPESSYGAYPHAISADGTLIVGAVANSQLSLDFTNIMAVPCVWRANDQGGYDMCELLPYPDKDWSGATPQYVQAVDVNNNATIIVGQITANNGFSQEPIVWRLGHEGWTYERLHPELLNPDNLPIPEYPGEGPAAPDAEEYLGESGMESYLADIDEYNSRVAPAKLDFMTKENREAYEAALAAYFEDWENNPYPNIDDYLSESELEEYLAAINAYYAEQPPRAVDYMTAEEKAAYNEAYDDYLTAYQEWEAKNNAYWEVMEAILDKAVPFEINSICISPSGKYMGIVASETDMRTWVTTTETYIFSLDSDEYWINNEGEEYYISSLSNDGASLGIASISNYYARKLVYSPAPGAGGVLLSDYIKDKDPQTYGWAEENMTHPLEVYDPETGEVTTEDTILTGTGTADDNFKVIATYVLNGWSTDETAPLVYSYIIPTGCLSEIRGISADDPLDNSITVSMDSHGVLTLKGDVRDVSVYDINGRLVFSASNPANGLKTGLDQGAYIVKANGPGKTAVAKAIL